MNKPLGDTPDPALLRRTVLIVALLNLSYFGVEFAVALRIGSVSLFADSVDFLEDASINLLIWTTLAWSLQARAKVGMLMAGILLIPTAATLWAAWSKFHVPIPPAPVPLSITALGALTINLSCALMLMRFRDHRGSLTRAAFLSARNDAVANVAIILAAVVTIFYPSAWPDLIVGLCIMVLNADAAREVWQAARNERRTADMAEQMRDDSI
jgi:Co/Zn/Cd efflux system component